jgi:hypothetical protein
MKPNLLIIGAMKCGSSSLHYYLSKHPEIEMSLDKELNFFSRDENYRQGIQWYDKWFRKTGPITGETSVTYTSYPQINQVPARIAASLGKDLKLIYIVRDPLQRIKSHYYHNLSKGRIHENLNEYILKLNAQSSYFTISMYFTQLKQYLDIFPQENILVLSSEKLKTDRENTMQSVFRFLGVSDDVSSLDFTDEKHVSSQKKIYNRFGNLVIQTPVLWRFVNSIPFTGKEIKQEKLSMDAAQYIYSVLKEDIEMFKKLTGNNFPEWTTYHSIYDKENKVA